MKYPFFGKLLKTFQFGSAKNTEQIRNSFFETTFLLLGYLAKVDGRISKSEDRLC